MGHRQGIVSWAAVGLGLGKGGGAGRHRQLGRHSEAGVEAPRRSEETRSRRNFTHRLPGWEQCTSPHSTLHADPLVGPSSKTHRLWLAGRGRLQEGSRLLQ